MLKQFWFSSLYPATSIFQIKNVRVLPVFGYGTFGVWTLVRHPPHPCQVAYERVLRQRQSNLSHKDAPLPMERSSR